MQEQPRLLLHDFLVDSPNYISILGAGMRLMDLESVDAELTRWSGELPR